MATGKEHHDGRRKRGGKLSGPASASAKHSMAAGKRIAEEGLENDMVDRIAGDPMLA